MKFCPECGGLLPVNDSNFCNWCGFCLKKKCSNCDQNGFTNYCTDCGYEMLELNSKSHKLENEHIIINSKPNNFILTEFSKESDVFDPEEDIRVKVNIIKGDQMKEIKLENGGGRRSIIIKKKENFLDLIRKIKRTYFPNRYSCLGNPFDYTVTILDFKKQKLCGFKNIEKYLAENGLRATQGPNFYLHLTERSKFNLNQFRYSNSTSINLVKLKSEESSETIVPDVNYTDDEIIELKIDEPNKKNKSY